MRRNYAAKINQWPPLWAWMAVGLSLLIVSAACRSAASDDLPGDLPGVSATAIIQVDQRAPLTVVEVGVLATRGAQAARQRWQPTMAWLSAQIPHTRFVIHPFDLEAMEQAVKLGMIDFVITNPGQAVQLGRQYALSWLATMTSRSPVSPTHGIGSALVVRRDSPYTRLAQLSGMPIAAVAERAFGGYLTLRYEVAGQGLNPNHYFSDVSFVGFPLDAGVYQLRDGAVDAAIVPVCLLENMHQEGLIDAGQYRVLNAMSPPGYGCQVSTPLYPNWSFARTERAGTTMAKAIARALLAMPGDHPAALAAGAAGWTSPIPQLVVDKLYQALDLHPLQKPWWQAAMIWVKQNQHWAWSAFFLVVILNIYHFWLEYRFSRSQKALEATSHRLKEKSAQLAHAQRVAIVGELGSSLAHEINQPLAAIRNYSEGGQIRLSQLDRTQGGAPQDLLPVFEKIHTQVERADAIVQRLRNLINKRAVKTERCDIEQLLSETLELLDHDLQLKQLRLHRLSHGLPISVVVDPVGVQQVLVNVITNAADACLARQHQGAAPDWQGTITIATLYQPDALHITVADNGVGLTAHDAPLTQAFVSTKADGLGLGLAICRDVAEAHGGQFSLAAAEPRGCCATLVLPVIKSQAEGV
ncbi:PhnD/SsuA/transferrin family substrate-binding protein [Photobacterium sp. MCCC 1A19761]|uniref:sensor histidine kinase n=1 Tax=Photobacterium sp. MCCC 1A19761 TaxID=3115000 RepID=UPI00307F5101